MGKNTLPRVNPCPNEGMSRLPVGHQCESGTATDSPAPVKVPAQRAPSTSSMQPIRGHVLTEAGRDTQSVWMSEIAAPPARDSKGRLLPGERLAHPSRKGTPNKVPAAVRDMIHESLSRAGGADYLFDCAMSDETSIRVAYIGLVKSVIPKQIEAEVGESLEELLGKAYQRRLEQSTRDATVIEVKPAEPTDATEGRKCVPGVVRGAGTSPEPRSEPR